MLEAGLGEEVGCALEDAGGEHGAGAVVVERDGEGEDAPGELWPPGSAGRTGRGGCGRCRSRAFRQRSGGPRANRRERGELLEEAAANEPVARLAEVFGGGVVAVDPVAGGVEDLDQNVGADGQRDAGVEEVARVHDDAGTAAAGLEGAKRGEQIVDGAVALEQVHVFHSAEVAFERGGHDDDGDVGAAAAQQGGDFGAELPGAEMVIEDRDVNLIEELGGLFDGGGVNES